jgi:uncharacterized alpha-E superfamily protein
MQRGGTSKDTWVQGGHGVDGLSLPGAGAPIELRRVGNNLSSRVASHLFWLGRYAERADHTARLAHVALTLLTGDTAPAPAVLAVLGRLCLAQGLVPPNTPQPAQGAAVFERTLLANLQQPDAGSVAFNLAAMQRAGAQIRERLSGEHWRLLQLALERFAERGGPGASAAAGQVSAEAAAAKPGRSRGLAIDALRRLSVDLAAVTGAQADRMTRDDGWRLLTVGRQIDPRVVLIAGLVGDVEPDHG